MNIPPRPMAVSRRPKKRNLNEIQGNDIKMIPGFQKEPQKRRMNDGFIPNEACMEWGLDEAINLLKSIQKTRFKNEK